MERLTKRDKDDVRAYCPSHVKCEGKCSECEHMDKMMEKLADYEDIGLAPEQLRKVDILYTELCKELGAYKKLEEQGLLLRLPCKVAPKYTISSVDMLERQQ